MYEEDAFASMAVAPIVDVVGAEPVLLLLFVKSVFLESISVSEVVDN